MLPLFSLSKKIGVALCVVFALSHVAYAQSPALQQARQAAKEQIERVTEDDEKEVASPAAESLDQQIKTVSSILSLMEREMSDVVDRLEKAAVANDTDLAQAASVLLLRMRLQAAHIELMRNQIAHERVSEIRLQSVVDALKLWRSEFYEPTMRQALDAGLLEQGYDALATVTGRLERVYADVVALTKSFPADSKQLLAHFDTASKHVQRAGKAYEQARVLFNEQQEIFLKTEPSADAGFVSEITLKAGPEGDFLCLPYNTSERRGCTPVFRMAGGEYYLLLTASGQPFNDLSSGVYSVTGPLTALKGIVAIEGASGALIVVQANKKIISAPASDTKEEAEGVATVLDTLLQKKNAGTVRGFIETEIKAITSAYKTFFTMAKFAKTLTKK